MTAAGYPASVHSSLIATTAGGLPGRLQTYSSSQSASATQPPPSRFVCSVESSCPLGKCRNCAWKKVSRIQHSNGFLSTGSIVVWLGDWTSLKILNVLWYIHSLDSTYEKKFFKQWTCPHSWLTFKCLDVACLTSMTWFFRFFTGALHREV